MSDYHIIGTTRAKNKATVAFHFTIPVGNNVAGKSYSACILEKRAMDETPITQVPNHATEFSSENDALVAGTIIEYVEVVEFNANETNLYKLGVVTARYTALEPLIATWIQEEFKFWGVNGNVT